ncbi:MAG: response regulator [Clostridiales bacterium]|jgi:putative two-component system response regulator|nr:response regulator [Clostridiales bacterium]
MMEYVPNRSVMIVDDNIDCLQTFKDIFKNRYIAYTAEGAAEALILLEYAIPGIILLDTKMPKINGYDMLKRLKEDPRWQNIPVIFITDDLTAEDEEHGLQAGAVDYMSKSVRAGIVLRRVQIHLEVQNYSKNLEQMVETKTNQLTRSQDTILDILANITTFRDHETGEHIRRTTMYTQLIANHLFKLGFHNYRLNRKYADDIIKCAKLHDIGKVAIKDSILHKPDRLSFEEFNEIKKHTIIGALMIDNAIRELGDDSSFLLVAKEIAMMHHEWWDGTGYPTGMSGEDIPLSARIIAIADSYDALTSERPYKAELPHEETVNIMLSETGSHFDPGLMHIISGILSDFRVISNDYRDGAVYARISEVYV